ncbi:MAG: VOC family protein [Limisphaerales bacterium]
MEKKIKTIPEGFHSITPYLIIRGAAQAMEFYKKAFGAQDRYSLPMPGGKIGHAEIQIGDSILMLGDENTECGQFSPQHLQGTPVGIMLYVENVDQVFEQAIGAGAKSLMPVADMFWGDRYGKLQDPFGHQWSIATHQRDLSPEEIKTGAEEFMGSKS